MRIKVCKDYGIMETIRKSDEYAELHHPGRTTMPSFYHIWEEMEVAEEELLELVKQGHGIMINC